jgi:hypothetical protein
MRSRFASLSLGTACLTGFFASRVLPQELHVDHGPRLSVIVDGAATPEKIPDELAYAHFILAIAEPDDPSPEQIARRTAALAPVQLSKTDTGSLVAALRGVHKQVDFLAREVTRLSTEDPSSLSRLDDLRLRRTRVLGEATTRLAGALSKDAAARLDQYIKSNIKKQIVIYGDPE